MLLPAAFPCDNAATAMRPRRAKMQSFDASSAQSHLSIQPRTNDSSHLVASCRALQSMIGNAVRSSYVVSPHFLSPTTEKKNQDPFQITRAWKNKQISSKASASRSVNKRGRSDSEDGNYSHERDEDATDFSTPKRRRVVPYDMPMGLSAEDFKALESVERVELPEHVASPSQQSDLDSGYGPSPILPVVGCDDEWTFEDDRILVETVLEKLQLTKRAWNDCARRLGKDKDSLGRRWKELVGEGEVGLRRGRRRKRISLDMQSW